MRRILQLDIVLFAIGYTAGCALASPAPGCALFGALACVLHRVVLKGSWSVLALGFFVATCLIAARPAPPALFDEPADVLLRGELVDGPRAFTDGGSYELRVRAIDGDAVDARVRLFVAGPSDAIGGELVETFARCSSFAPPEFPHDRGDEARALGRGLVARCSAREELQTIAVASPLRQLLTRRRLAVERRLREVLGRRAGVPIAMLTGTRGLVSESERRAHQRAGTAHLLAISGVHFGALAAIAWFFALFVTRRIRRVTRTIGARRASSGFVLATMLGYLLFVGAPISAVRASVAVGSLVVALLIGRRASGLAAVSLGATGLLVWSPTLVWDLGFQLSFAATAAIVLFWQRLPAAIEHDRYAFETPSRLRRVRDSALRFVLMSWAATAATAPILTAALGEFSLVAFVTNLVAVPVVSLAIFPALLAGTALLDVAPAIGEPVVWWATEAMLRLSIFVEEVASLPGAVLTPGATSGWWSLLVVLCVFVVISDRLRWRTFVSAATVVTVASLIAFRPAPPAWRLHFIPVGQGDATLVESPHGARILFDAGGSTFGRDPGLAVVVPYLRRIGVTSLDAVVVTHADTDHAGGVPAVLEHVEVARVVTEPCDVGVDEIALSRWTDHGSRNDRSIVARLDVSGVVVLLTGDVETEAERRWSPHRVHLLKVAHHGSKTSTTPGFVEVARPVVSVVSAGRHNRFGHPHPDVVDRLRAVGSALSSTSRHGLIVVSVDADGVVESRARRP